MRISSTLLALTTLCALGGVAHAEPSRAPCDRELLIAGAGLGATDSGALTPCSSDGSDRVLDSAITAEIHMRLARDATLNAPGIDVDTVGGHVVLRGSVADAAASERATRLARSVDGVLDVDNDLRLQPRR